MKRLTQLMGVALLLLVGCRAEPTTPTPTLPPPIITTATAAASVTPAPPPLTAAETVAAYLQAWQAKDYAAMYQYLTPASQAARSLADFTFQYTHTLDIMTATGVTATVTAVTDTAGAASVHLVYPTVLIGVVETDVTFTLEKNADQWGIVFQPALLWPDLVDGKQLYMVPFVPDRGILYDRNGVPMVEMAEVYAVGMVPAELEPESRVPGTLAVLFGIPAPLLQARIDAAAPDQYLAIGEIAKNDIPTRYEWLIGAPGTRWTAYTSRFYYGAGATAHVAGYTIFIPPDELPAYQAKGYAADQRFGSTGLERWGEDLLRGTNGGQLTLLDAAGNPLEALVIKQPVYPQDIYTTLDFELQQAAQFALGGYEAAAVVLNRETGEVLALVSSPTFDPNLFEPQNLNRQFADNGAISLGLLNHATQDAYAAGSVFKIVTFSASLTSKLFTPESEYMCTGKFEELGPSLTLTDWLEEGHGKITLQEGLSGSCNPYFWHMGLNLHNFNPQWLPDTARAFGLGQLTGIVQLDETPGVIPDPAWKRENRGEAWETLDSLNLSIGQGDVLVTPLQIARMAAAVGNGGKLLQPQLILKIQAPEGVPTNEFTPIVVGQLPLDEAQLTALQTAMYNVTRPPIGTARNRFRTLPGWLRVAGKTGTAEDPGIFGVQEPHAWFTGYTFAEREGKPDIAFAVWVANRGQGSDIAAPIARRIIESYFGLTLTRYPWEESVGVPATPEPTPTEGVPGEEVTPAP